MNEPGSPDGLGRLGDDFGVAKDKQWVSLKQRRTQFGDNKNWPGTPLNEELKIEVKDTEKALDGITEIEPGVLLGTDRLNPQEG